MLKQVLVGTFTVILLYYSFRWYYFLKEKQSLPQSKNPLKREDSNTDIKIEEIGVFNLLYGYEQLVSKEWKQFNHTHLLQFYSIVIKDIKYILFVDFFGRNTKDESGHPKQVNCLEYFVFKPNQIQRLFPQSFKFNKQTFLSEPSVYSCFLPFGNSLEDIKLSIKNQMNDIAFNPKLNFSINYYPVIIDDIKIVRLVYNDKVDTEVDFDKRYYEMDFDLYLSNINTLY